MDKRIWLIALAAVAICVILIDRYLHGAYIDCLVANNRLSADSCRTESWSLGLEILATILAASIVGCWTTKKGLDVRVRITTINVAAWTTSGIWIAWFFVHGTTNQNILACDRGGMIVGPPTQTWSSAQIAILLVELGVTTVAALTIGFWTARRGGQ